MAGSSGGGAFVIVYLFAVALVAIPILVAELMLGRYGGQSPPTAMLLNAQKESRSRWWSGVGWLGAGAGFLILGFYSVIGGWVLDYAYVSMSAGFSGVGADEAQTRFAGLLSNPLRLLLWFTVFLGHHRSYRQHRAAQRYRTGNPHPDAGAVHYVAGPDRVQRRCG